MGKTKGLLEVRLGKLTKNNQYWFNEFKKTFKNKNSFKQYESTLINIMEIKPDQDINTITYEDIEDFLSHRKTLNDFNTKISHITKFLTFLSNICPLSLSIEDLNKIRFSSSDIKDGSLSSSSPLKIKEVNILRNILKDKNITLRFTFELAYKCGLTLDELSQCNMATYEMQSKKFILNNNTIPVDDNIHNMIINNENLLVQKKRSAYQYYFSRIEEIFRKALGTDRDLRWQDICRTRELYFFRCSLCDRLFENTADNWILVQDENDFYNTKWIVCKSCGLEGKINE